MHKERPLSPHLQVYKPQLTSILSIFHRGTGVFLAMATPVLVYWLWAIAQGADSFNKLQDCFSSWLGQLALIGWTFCLFYHLCNGIRHLFWDIGRGYEIETLYKSGKIVMLAAGVLTALTLYCAYSRLGGV